MPKRRATPVFRESRSIAPIPLRGHSIGSPAPPCSSTWCDSEIQHTRQVRSTRPSRAAMPSVSSLVSPQGSPATEERLYLPPRARTRLSESYRCLVLMATALETPLFHPCSIGFRWILAPMGGQTMSGGPQSGFLVENADRESSPSGWRMPVSSSTTLQWVEEVDSGIVRNYATPGKNRQITRR